MKQMIKPGDVCGRLKVMSPDPDRRFYVLCDCECGSRDVSVYRYDLTRADSSKRVQSCGCLRKEKAAEMGSSTKTHGHYAGDRASKEVKTYEAMIRRCYDPSAINYHNYGGREDADIVVCDRWLESFEAFFSDMGPAPGPGYQIHRKNNDLGYFPENCVWVTCETNARHRRNSWMLEYRGEQRLVIELVEEHGMNYQTVRSRLARKMTLEEALTTPVRGRGPKSEPPTK